MSSITLGVDLASQNKKTAICALDWDARSPVIRMLAVGNHEGTEFHDKFIITTIAGMRHFEQDSIVKAGIDAPFGWPDEFVEALSDYHNTQRWPSGMDNPRTAFYWRETDRWVRTHAHKVPLSVSSDKIAIVAMRCAVVLDELRYKLGPDAVIRTGDGLVCEVYPDPALRYWTACHAQGLRRRETYKGAAAANRRAELLGILQQDLPLDDPDGLLGLCVEQDHAFDALLSALVARASFLGLTEGAPPDERIIREGWIHLPTAPLRDLSPSQVNTP